MTMQITGLPAGANGYVAAATDGATAPATPAAPWFAALPQTTPTSSTAATAAATNGVGALAAPDDVNNPRGGGVANKVVNTRPGEQFVPGLVKYGPRLATSATDPGAFHHMLATRGPGWAAADGTISVPLQDGSHLWLFGDTILNLKAYDGSLRLNADFVRNSAVLHQGAEARTLVKGNTFEAEDFLKPTQPGQWYWPGHGVAERDEVVLFMHRITTAPGPSGWNFKAVGTDMVRLDAHDLSVKSRREMPGGADTKWGVSVVSDDEYTYVYGMEKQAGPFDRWATVARAPKDHVGDSRLEYWNGERWTHDPQGAARIGAGVSDAFTVRQTPDGRWALITQEIIFGKGIRVAVSDSPAGPFTNFHRIDPGPTVNNGEISYNAQVHPSFDRDGKMLVSWNINRTDASLPGPNELDSYQPRFKAVDLDKLLRPRDQGHYDYS